MRRAARPPEPAQAPDRVAVLFGDSPQPMYAFDEKNLRFLSVNKAALAFYGYSREEFLKLTIMDIRPPWERVRLRRAMARIRRSGIGPFGVWTHLKRGGELAEVEVTAQRFRAPSGRFAIIAIVTDATERLRVQRELEGSKRRLSSILDAAPDFIYELDRKGRVLLINKRVPGYDKGEIVGKPIYDFLRRSSPALWRRKIAGVFKTGRPAEFETEGMMPGGQTTWYRNRLSPVRGELGISSLVAVTTEITEAKAQHERLARAERELRESQRRIAAILKSAPDIVFTLDEKGRLTFVNRASGQAAVGKPLFPRLEPEARRIWRRSLAKLFKGRTVDPFETHDTDPRTGQSAWYLNVLSPLREGGRIVAAVSIAHDITERKALEAKLADSESYWRDLLAQSPDYVLVIDRLGRITYINRLAAGFKMAKVIGSSHLDYISPEHRAEVRRAHSRVLKTGRSETLEMRGMTDDGRLTWYSMQLSPLRRGGRIESVVSVGRDISEEKTLRGRFESVFRSSRDAIDYLALDGTLLEVNPAYETMTGYSREELIHQKRMYEISPPEYHHLDKQAMARLVKTGEPVEFEKEYIHKSGGRVPVNVTAFVVRGPSGRTEGFAAIIKDITERRRLEREILEAGAREQSKLGRDLHDSLGQTITGISLLAKGLRSRLSRRGAPESGEALRLAELSSHAVRQARGLARGLLPAELLEAGFGAALEELAANAEELFGIRCALQCPRELRLPNEAMAVQLYRIAQEAVHNAAKHARSRAGVRLTVSVGPRRLRLSIVDDGVGIAPPARRGRGLGLGIMERRAQMLGGTLAVRRRPRGGTEVLCDCPLSALQRKP